MGSDQQFCLRWNNHQNTLVSIFDNLLESGTLVDCTLAAEGRSLQAHKVVLSACSPYFAMLLREHYDKFPILILKDIKFQELQAMMNYMYRGEVNITQDQLGSFLKAAESLQIRGLTDSGVDNNANRDVGLPKKIPDPRKISGNISRSRSPPMIMPQPKKYLKPPVENHHAARTTADPEGSSSPSLKRRKLLPPIKSEALVVTPINPTPYNNVDVISCEVSAQPQSVQPPEVPKVSIPSPSMSSAGSPQADMKSEIQRQKDHLKVKAEQSDDVYNNNEDTNDGSYSTLDENAEIDSKDEAQMALSAYQNSPVVSYDNLSDRSTGQDSNSGMQDSQAYEEHEYDILDTNTNVLRINMTDLKMYRCSQCNKMYRYKCTLQRHITYECGKMPNFHCPYCPVSMKRKSNLMSHIASKHSMLLN